MSSNWKVRYDALRGTSSGFISKKEVRDAIMEKCDKKCVKCSSTDNLQVDHIVSVYLSAKGEFPIEELNTYENLTILCETCNLRKSPNEV